MPDQKVAARRYADHAIRLTLFGAALAMLGACTSSGSKSMVSKTGPKVYLAQSETGAQTTAKSPRITAKSARLPRGGGRAQIGKPYMIKGRWYRPEEDPDYSKVGAASWYGDAFHGRLTANGEIYDMTHLTAAHPTMPLPSYARVTNTKNGHSVVVRVNDRGPFAHDRIIDLSKRAAEVLDYAHAGVAKVKVEFVGRAPLDGSDDEYLMASYRPGGEGPADGETSPGTLVAMSVPTDKLALAEPSPRLAVGGPSPAFAGLVQHVSYGDPVLPAFGPIAPDRPSLDLRVKASGRGDRLKVSYAGQSVDRIAEVFATLLDDEMKAGDVADSWKRQRPGFGMIAAGTFPNRSQAEAHFKTLSAFGRTSIEAKETSSETWYSVEVYADGRYSLDDVLQVAWADGASDAMTVRE